MTFLLLINKVYDEHMVDQQEQFQIKQVCLQAIMELLTTNKTFPIVGRADSQFYHTPRWQRINCDSIRWEFPPFSLLYFCIFRKMYENSN